MELSLVMCQSLICFYLIVIMNVDLQTISLNFIKTRNAFVPYLYIQSCNNDLLLNKLTWYGVQGFDFAVNHNHICDDDD